MYHRNSRAETINFRDSNVDPMCYPLLFPYGTAGHVENAQHRVQRGNRHRLTIREFYAFRLHFRNLNIADNTLFSFGTLFQQYCVHARVKVEANELNFLRFNQAALRVDAYQGLMDHVANQAAAQNVPIGRVFILPSSYQVQYINNIKWNFFKLVNKIIRNIISLKLIKKRAPTEICVRNIKTQWRL